ncbi:hypothetical protein PMAYCL1PPCAC_17620, partial [Pristionchus mayeri]
MSIPSLILLSFLSLLLSGEDCIDRSLYCTPVECETRPVYALEYCRRTCKVCNVTRPTITNDTIKYVKKNETKKTNATDEPSFITPPIFREIISDSVQSSQSPSHSSDRQQSPDPLSPSSSPPLSQATQRRRTLALGPFAPSQPQPFFPEPLAQPLRGSVDTYSEDMDYQRRMPSGYPHPSPSFPQSPSPSLPPMTPSASSSQPRLSLERYRQQLSNQYAPKKNTAIPSRREERAEKRVATPTLLPEMERSRQDAGWGNRVESPWGEQRPAPPLPVDENTSALAIADLITLLGCRDRDPSTCSRITTDACLSRPGYYLKLCPVKCRNCSGLSCFDSVKVDCEEVLLLGGCRLPSAHEYCPRTCNLCPTTTQQPAMTEPLVCTDQLETCSHLAQAGVCNHPYSRTALQMFCSKSCGFCKEGDSPVSSSYSDSEDAYSLPSLIQQRATNDLWRRNSWKK